jgi:hypothetical protein
MRKIQTLSTELVLAPLVNTPRETNLFIGLGVDTHLGLFTVCLHCLLTQHIHILLWYFHEIVS